MTTVRVDRVSFGVAFNHARRSSSLIANMTSVFEYDNTATYYMTLDWNSGYAIREDGELVYLFSTVRGRGDALVKAALSDGADHLNCFDGFLVKFYERFGFSETKREPNWTPGGPDVVWMSL